MRRRSWSVAAAGAISDGFPAHYLAWSTVSQTRLEHLHSGANVVRVASRNFVTGCLITDRSVRRRLTAMYWRRTRCMPMTRLCRCCFRGEERLVRGGYGLMFAMTGPPVVKHRRRCGSLTHQIAKVNIRAEDECNTWRGMGDWAT
jgi:hypothetical protein